MLHKEGFILYIGKAKNLKKRVASYFSNKATQDIKTSLLSSQIFDIDIMVTHTEKEALILESQLIKKFQPKYNICLKDDKSYPYIKVTITDPFPRTLVVRQKINDGSLYFGPYPSIGSSRKLQRMIYDLFPLRDCKQKIDLVSMQPKCINLDIGKCIGPCIIKTTKPRYDILIKQLILLLSGKNLELIKTLKKEMSLYASKKEFEKAAASRDKLIKIKKLTEQQTVQLETSKNYQVWATSENDTIYYALIQTYTLGKLLHQKGLYLHKIKGIDPNSFLQQSFLEIAKESIPNEIISNDQFINALKPLIAFKQFSRIKVSTPKKGVKMDLLKRAQLNANWALTKLLKQKRKEKDGKTNSLLDSVKELLTLPKIPYVIMGFDISHLQGTDIVGSSVYFKNAKPLKSQYRQFNIKTVKGKSNDPKSIAESVSRRLNHCINNKETPPDLLLIDGGITQLNATIKVLKTLGITHNTEVISLAKKNEEIYSPHFRKPLQLNKTHPVLKLFQHIRDESHRFALKHQKTRRKKRLFHLPISNLKGMGPKRIQALYAKFGSIKNIRKASISEISQTNNMSTNRALQIKQFLESIPS